MFYKYKNNDKYNLYLQLFIQIEEILASYMSTLEKQIAIEHLSFNVNLHYLRHLDTFMNT